MDLRPGVAGHRGPGNLRRQGDVGRAPVPDHCHQHRRGLRPGHQRRAHRAALRALPRDRPEPPDDRTRRLGPAGQSPRSAAARAAGAAHAAGRMGRGQGRVGPVRGRNCGGHAMAGGSPFRGEGGRGRLGGGRPIHGAAAGGLRNPGLSRDAGRAVRGAGVGRGHRTTGAYWTGPGPVEHRRPAVAVGEVRARGRSDRGRTGHQVLARQEAAARPGPGCPRGRRSRLPGLPSQCLRRLDRLRERRPLRRRRAARPRP